IIAGLILGKFLGIVGACFIMVRMKWATLPVGVVWRHIIGVGFLAGVGFTMSLFITNLAFDQSSLNTLARTGILVGSLIAGVTGFLVLKFTKNNKVSPRL